MNQPATPQLPPDIAAPALIIAALLSLAIFIGLAVIILRNPNIGTGQKLGWIIAAFLAPLITLIVYLIVSPGKRRGA